ncbi:hypothetical protein [Halobacterium noricense]|uniref:hypothetical protein n=1 Tax=Halobacterium noricense TaxID=223182 RepID=UPI001E57A7E1|nr:hypothetical protein [Halobacterium noricense]UHH27037.1 hypothetical protein LT974_17300 [Halobacterium noricense]
MSEQFVDGVNLPWGPYGERYTDYEDSFTFLQLDFEDLEVVKTTEDNWPTVIVGEQNEARVGVAIGHVTQLNDKPAEEIDIFVDADQNWWALVEFESLDAAISGGQYGAQDYEDYTVIPCDRRTEGFDLFNEYADDRVTPIFEMENDSAAFAIQRASNYGTLNSIFRLDTYTGVTERQKALEREVLPREDWLSKNSLTEIADNLSDNN